MSKRRHEPAREHARAGLLGVGSNADTVPGKGTAQRSLRATMVARTDAQEAVRESTAEVRVSSPLAKPVKSRWTWTAGQRAAERLAKSRGAGTQLCPGTPEGEVPNWHKATVHKSHFIAWVRERIRSGECDLKKRIAV